MQRTLKQTKWFFLVVGALFLSWVIRKLGVAEVWSHLEALGWRLALPILLFVPNYLVRSLAWGRILGCLKQRSPTWLLFRLRIAAGAVATLTPFKLAVGESTRAWLLAASHPGTASTSSVVIDRTLQSLTTFLLIIVGCLTLLFITDLPLYIEAVLVLIPIFLLTLLTLFFLLQQTGIFQKISRLIGFLHIRRLSPEFLAKLQRIDRLIIDFYETNHRAAVTAVLLHLTGRTTTAVEILLIGKLLHLPITIAHAVFFASVIPLTGFFSSFIPGSLGVVEAIMAALFGALSWDPAAGLSLQIVRRLRALFWLVTGLVFFYQLPHPNLKERIGQKNQAPDLLATPPLEAGLPPS